MTPFPMSVRVSVVTPFHNTAEYLAECIESVLAQTFGDFEYILHDNASTDGSSEIAIRFAERDNRIRYVRVDSLLPQVSNYNRALQLISPSSKYCKLVQADDWITADCLERMVRLAETNPRVGLVSSYYLEGTELRGAGLPYTQTVLQGREIARQHLLGTYFLFGTPTTVLYRSEIVRSRRPFYSEGRYHEDTEACYEILRSWDFGFVHQVLSFARSQSGSTYDRMRVLDSAALDGLICLCLFGRDFLSADEFQARLTKKISFYYKTLARAFICFSRRPGYTQFHERGLSTVGLSLDRKRLFLSIGKEVLTKLLCPREILATVMGRNAA